MIFEEKRKPINLYELWEENWNNAYKFFNSKGNINTKSKLKDKWFKDFKNMIESLCYQIEQ